MNELDLPPAPPLPPEVRERALRTVLAGIEAPRRRRPRVLAVAAAAVAVLTVAATVALSGLGEQPNEPSLDQIATGSPITSGDPHIDEALLRCANAVRTDGRTADYPPTNEWRTTGVLLQSIPMGEEAPLETAIAINDSFACFVGPSAVHVSAPQGTAVGTASVAWLTPAVLTVLNPQRQPVALIPRAAADVRPGDPTAPVQLMSFGVSGVNTANYRITVGDSYNGPIPEPTPIAVIVEDR